MSHPAMDARRHEPDIEGLSRSLSLPQTNFGLGGLGFGGLGVWGFRGLGFMGLGFRV